MVNPSSFEILVFSLSNAALMSMGFLPHPDNSEAVLNLEEAAQNIDFLNMLSEKTKNNLSPQEANLLHSMLYDLRLKFIEAKQRA